MQHDPQQQQLTSEQKMGFVFLLIFAAVTIGMGVLQMRNSIYGPFVRKSAPDKQSEQAAALLNETIRAQRVDTDQDGITDHDELNFFETSPYLPDTDSDGITDKEELDAGTDPLCPAGQDCGTTATLQDTPNKIVITSELGEQAQTPVDILGIGPQPGDPGDPSQILQLIQDPQALRQAIAQTGQVPLEVLEQISDQELMEMAVGSIATSTTQ